MLTKRQKQILDFVTDFIKDKSYSPSLEEIRRHFRLKSVSTIHDHIETLKIKGYLKKEAHQPRGFEPYSSKGDVTEIPLLGLIAAGEPIEAIENPEPITISKSLLDKSGRHYALKVKGNSMIDEGIFDGDTVVVRQQKDANNGETVVALIKGNEATLKKIYKEGNGFLLQPANPHIKPIFTKELIVQGKVISVIRNYQEQPPTFPKESITPIDTNRLFKENLQLFKLQSLPKFPSTRFQGSKAKLAGWIWENVKNLKFDSVIDLFGGTGAVSYMFKQKGKGVIYNDYLKFNYLTGLALVENSNTKLTDNDLNFILSRKKNAQYPDFIQKTFKDIYYTDEENLWLDIVSTNIKKIKDRYKQALAYFALFQACIIKRPYNLFHRKNLYLRKANVKRSFGNKTTWDKSFTEHFLNFVNEANEAVFNNGRKNLSFNQNAFNLNQKSDLIYIDTPYMSSKGIGVNYLEFYHFLEGLCNYENWDRYIDYNSKHRKFKNRKSVWTDQSQIHSAFDRLFKKNRAKKLIVSYRSDGIPSIKEMVELLKKYKKNIILKQKPYRYALNHRRTNEVLFIAID